MGHTPKKTKIKVRTTGHLGKHKPSKPMTPLEREIKDLENRSAMLDDSLDILTGKEWKDTGKEINQIENKLEKLRSKL